MEIKRSLPTLLVGALIASSLSAQIRNGQKLPEPDKEQINYYKRELIPMPKGEVMEVGSLALLPDKKLAIGTRRGEIWICSGAYGDDLSKVTWQKVFTAAHEPLGMFHKDGWIYFTDRDGVARIKDKNNDGRYDEYEVVSNAWGISGDYHEYTFGSTPDKDGNIWTVLCLTGSFHAKAQWRGWCLKITPDGKAIPTCSGIRSPGGIGFNAEGDAFYTDNQGKWNGTSCIKHLKPLSFTGSPVGNIFYKDAPNMGKRPQDPKDKSRIAIEAEKIPELVPPAVQIPHGKVGQSPTAIITDHSGGKFGPFAKQLLIGEQTHSQVQRIYLEKVNGVYQGAVWKMLTGFECGIVPMRQGTDGTLFVGGTNRGWASIGPRTFSLERVRWTGTTPFEMSKMEALKDGFKFSFTKPLDKATAGKAENYKVGAWTYIYQSAYGSPEVDKVKPKVTSVSVADDGLSVTVKLDKLTKGHVHHFDCSALRSKDSKPLWHPNVYYTLNQIPKK